MWNYQIYGWILFLSLLPSHGKIRVIFYSVFLFWLTTDQHRGASSYGLKPWAKSLSLKLFSGDFITKMRSWWIQSWWQSAAGTDWLVFSHPPISETGYYGDIRKCNLARRGLFPLGLCSFLGLSSGEQQDSGKHRWARLQIPKQHCHLLCISPGWNYSVLLFCSWLHFFGIPQPWRLFTA